MKKDRKESNYKETQRPRTTSITRERDKSVVNSEEYVVFDFTDLHRPAVSDLALVLTARLQKPPDESVWAREMHPRTAEILRALRLDHMFPHYPDPDDLC